MKQVEYYKNGNRTLRIKYEGIKKLLEKQNKEIERLKEQLNDEIDEELKQSEIMVKKQKEIERLNNIINELEEYIKPFLYMLNGITDRDIYEECQLDDFTMIMEKLQELKGSDKE